MNVRLFILVVFAALFLSGLSFAATCSYDAFIQSCAQCPFDAYGKMNETCSDSFQTDAKTCLGKEYPIMSGKYLFGQCPQIDECVSKLTACKDANRPGSNKDECSNQGSKNCFVMADQCAVAANKICSEGKTEEEAGWNQVGTGINSTEQPTQNITPQNITQPSGNGTMTRDEAAGNIWNSICPGYPIGLVLLLGLLFVKIK
jgi:hypothetical protein